MKRETIAARVADLCREKNISVYRLEKDLGMSLGSVRKWETHDPTVSRIQAVAEYLGLTIDELLRGTRPKQ